MAIQEFQFVGYDFNVTLDVEDDPKKLSFAFFKGKDKNFIICKKRFDEIKDYKLIYVGYLKYFLRRRMEEVLNCNVMGADKDKFIDQINSSHVIAFHDGRLYEMGDEPYSNFRLLDSDETSEIENIKGVKNFLYES